MLPYADPFQKTHSAPPSDPTPGPFLVDPFPAHRQDRARCGCFERKAKKEGRWDDDDDDDDDVLVRFSPRVAPASSSSGRALSRPIWAPFDVRPPPPHDLFGFG